MNEVLYSCGIGMCPQVVYECGLGACPTAEGKDGIVTIEHPGHPEKGKVVMTAAEWNALLRDGRPIEP